MMRVLTLSLLLGAACAPGHAAETLVVHEWGTFTSFQDEKGAAIGRLNIDDEPVPDFVHDAVGGLLHPLNDHSPAFVGLGKGFPLGDSEVTMRLETPVLYFHPASGQQLGAVDVRVDFHGGWLTQYYPDALVNRPGRRVKDQIEFDPLSASTLGMLHWSGLSVGEGAVGFPETTSPVWMAPRQVAAANVRSAGGEGERFLFYRGVGHLDAPVRVIRDEQGALTLHPVAGLPAIARYFLVDIRPDGTLAYRTIKGGSPGAVDAGAETFASDLYALDRKAALREDLAGELAANGMFADEAAALLNTWDASYFRSPGLRLFFLVPRAWVDTVLPLAIAPQAAVERAMVGRIELISPRQRELLARIAKGPHSNAGWWQDFIHQRVWDSSNPAKPTLRPGGEELRKDTFSGPGAFARLKLQVPADYADFLALGRFREALVLARVEAEPKAAQLPLTEASLMPFAEAYGLTELFLITPRAKPTSQLEALTAPPAFALQSGAVRPDAVQASDAEVPAAESTRCR